MAGFLGLYERTERIVLARDPDTGQDYWLEVRVSLPEDRYGKVQRALVAPSVVDNTVAGATNVPGWHVEWITQAVVDWNLTDAAGEPLPMGPKGRDPVGLTRESVWRMPGPVVQRVFQRCQTLHAEAAQEVSEPNFRGDDDGGPESDGERPASTADDPGPVEPVLDRGGILAAAWPSPE